MHKHYCLHLSAHQISPAQQKQINKLGPWHFCGDLQVHFWLKHKKYERSRLLRDYLEGWNKGFILQNEDETKKKRQKLDTFMARHGRA